MPLLGPSPEVRVWAYGLQPETATTDSLIVGHPTRGRIGVTANNRLRADRLSGRTDISCFVTSVRIDRGRRGSLEQAEPGRCVITLDATDRRFDPIFNAGAYSGGVRRQLFRRMTPIMVAVAGLTRPDGAAFTRDLPLFAGWVDEVRFTYGPTGALFTAEVSCMDALGMMADVTTQTVAGSGDRETLSARMTRLVDAAGLAGGFDYATGTQGRWGYKALADARFPLQPVAQGVSVLAAAKVAAASSDALVWAANDGAVKWQPVTAPPRVVGALVSDAYSASSTTINMPDSVLPVVSQELTADVIGNALPSLQSPQIDTDSWVTTVRLTRVGGTEQVAVSAGVDADGRSELNRSDMINVDDGDVRTIAATIIARSGDRPPLTVSLEVEPFLSDMAMFLALMDLNGLVAWEWTQVGMSMIGVLLSVSHDIRPGREWRCRLVVSEWTASTWASAVGRALDARVVVS